MSYFWSAAPERLTADMRVAVVQLGVDAGAWTPGLGLAAGGLPIPAGVAGSAGDHGCSQKHSDRQNRPIRKTRSHDFPLNSDFLHDSLV
jgi:hypothetical protein